MVVCSAAANSPVRQSEGSETIGLDVCAFGCTGEDLLWHRQGDPVNVMGQPSGSPLQQTPERRRTPESATDG